MIQTDVLSQINSDITISNQVLADSYNVHKII